MGNVVFLMGVVRQHVYCVCVPCQGLVLLALSVTFGSSHLAPALIDIREVQRVERIGRFEFPSLLQSGLKGQKKIGPVEFGLLGSHKRLDLVLPWHSVF